MRALQYLNKFFFKYRYRLILGLTITVFSKIFALQVPQLIRESLIVVEDYQKNIITDLGEVRHQLIINILFIVGAALISGFFTFMMRQTLIVMSRLIESDLKNEIYRQYQRLSLSFYKQNRTGDLMNRISEDVGKVRMYFGPAIMYTMNMLVLFLVALTKMIRIDAKLTLYTLLPFPVLSLSIYFLSKTIHIRSNTVQQYLSKLTTFSQEIFSGIYVIKAYSIEDQTSKNFNELATVSKEKNIDLYKAQALFFPLMILLIGIKFAYFCGMKLSVIIVNYNVKYFLEQCLHSVRKSVKDVDAEVFVVDNNSVDGSVEMVREKFPEVLLIANKENTGFSKANNQAIERSKGEYTLLLNPDTLVEDDTFKKIVKFMDSHPDAGGLGVKMVDGKGNFLPESKRGLPTPSVAFYKIFGFSRLFPKSKIFGKYHLGYLDKDETNEVEILSGAFMLLRKSVLDKIGLLDETFFMYGEDIDLSYRIIQAGYKNYYYPEARIIHYKGESTKKSSVNYVMVFYRAMIIFAEKHFSQKNAKSCQANQKTA